MTKDDYKRLNDYLNDTFIYLEKHDGFFIQNMNTIFYLNYIFRENFKDITLSHKFHENNLTSEEVFLLAREKLEKINPKYLEEFNKLINSGKLEFFKSKKSINIEKSSDYNILTEIENNEEKLETDSSCNYIHDGYYINLVRNYNYIDICILIHEFIHSTNTSCKTSEYRYILTEFFSIYFEMVTLNEFFKEGVNSNEIDIFDRLKNFVVSSNYITLYDVIFTCYDYFGEIKENSYIDLNEFKIFNISKEEFEHQCKKLLNYYDKEKINYSRQNNKFDIEIYRSYICSLFKNNYRYFLGTIFSAYCILNGDKDKIIYLNDHINDEKIRNMYFIDVLKLIDIDLTDEDINKKLLDSAKKYYEELNKYASGNINNCKLN